MNYTEQSRRIFGPYWNGAEYVHADPIRAHRRLMQALRGALNEALKEARDQDPAVRSEARERLSVAALEAFEMVPFDPRTGTGALEEDAIGVLKDYLEWTEVKKKRDETQPTSYQPTGLGFSQTEEGYPTPITSPSGPTSHDCGCSERGK